MRYQVTVHGKTFVVFVEDDGDGTLAVVAPASAENGSRPPLERLSFSMRGPLSVISGARGATPVSIERALDDGVYDVSVRGGRPLRCEVEDERRRLARTAAGASRGERSGPRVIRSVMPGIVLKVLAAPGASVAAKDPLLIVEAMKMQNEIRCETAGIVAKVHVKAGQSVAAGAPLVELAPQAS